MDQCPYIVAFASGTATGAEGCWREYRARARTGEGTTRQDAVRTVERPHLRDEVGGSGRAGRYCTPQLRCTTLQLNDDGGAVFEMTLGRQLGSR